MALGTLTVTKRYTSGVLEDMTFTDRVTNFDNAYPAYGDAPESIIGKTFVAAMTGDTYIVEALAFDVNCQECGAPMSVTAAYAHIATTCPCAWYPMPKDMN